MQWDLQLLAFGLLGIILVFLLGWIIRLELKLRRLLGGGRAASLEELIVRLTKNVDRIDRTNSAIQTFLEVLDKRVRRSIQHVRTIRFNPFRDQGGNQSFATAFLDEEGSGAVISSLYSRDKVSIYAKPVNNYRSDFELSAEEKQSLEH